MQYLLPIDMDLSSTKINCSLPIIKTCDLNWLWRGKSNYTIIKHNPFTIKLHTFFCNQIYVLCNIEVVNLHKHLALYVDYWNHSIMIDDLSIIKQLYHIVRLSPVPTMYVTTFQNHLVCKFSDTGGKYFIFDDYKIGDQIDYDIPKEKQIISKVCINNYYYVAVNGNPWLVDTIIQHYSSLSSIVNISNAKLMTIYYQSLDDTANVMHKSYTYYLFGSSVEAAVDILIERLAGFIAMKKLQDSSSSDSFFDIIVPL